MAAISGTLGTVAFTSGYTTNAFKWDMTIESESLETTPFTPTSSFRTYTAGLLKWSGSYECYVDDTTPLPTAGQTGSATLTAHTSRTYTGTILVNNSRVGVAADGPSRTVTVSFDGTGVLTAA